MNKREYTVPIKDGMIVKHGSMLRFTVKSGKEVLEDDLCDARFIGGALTRASIMYNALSMSGGISWFNPSTGRSIKRPKTTIRARIEDIVEVPL